jgi:hypothetical protein
MPVTWNAIRKRDGEVTVWESEGTAVRISVHQHIAYPKDAWLLTCRNAPFDCHQLKAKDIDAAKREAVSLVRKWLRSMLDELKGA